MKIELEHNKLEEISSDTLIVPVFSDDNANEGILSTLNRMSEGIVASLLETKEFNPKRHETAYIPTRKDSKIARLLLIGAGERSKVSQELLAELAGNAVRLMRKKKIANGVMVVRNPAKFDEAHLARLIAEVALLAPYEQNKYQHKEEDDFQVARFALAFNDSDSTDALQTVFDRAAIVAEATNFARDLSVEPGNRLTPRDFAQRSQEMAQPLGLNFEVMDEEKLKELGMGAILAVSQGSEEPAQLIVLRYKGSKAADSRPIALVGKGITFDSGGICLKPREGMWEMKTDMSGGATVVGTLMAIAKLKPEIDVIGIVAASENLPSGKSYKPGDVLKAYSGKMVEVIDTDAEGRLVLADALHYATEQNPACIIDLATLTGACIIALGNLRAGMMGTDEALVNEIRDASVRAGEKVWQLPLHKEYSDMIKSDIADIKNLGGRYAGAITAAAFLQEFVGDIPWVHLDIAGTAWLEETKPEMAKGPTGYGVRTLVEFILARTAQ